jgi:hypothetical protein
MASDACPRRDMPFYSGDEQGEHGLTVGVIAEPGDSPAHGTELDLGPVDVEDREPDHDPDSGLKIRVQHDRTLRCLAALGFAVAASGCLPLDGHQVGRRTRRDP